MTIEKKITYILFCIVLVMILVLTIAIITITWDSKIDESKLKKNYANTSVFDQNNSLIDANWEKYVTYDKISSHIISAFITLEDKRFLSHHGVDYKRILSATLKNIASFSYKEGASTITQQLIKNTQLTNDKTLKRKLSEIKLAKKLEKMYSKQDIIEMYLNAIYFGNGLYGIESASRVIFNCPASQITLEQSAVLAGIVKNPKKYSPLNNIEQSTIRRDLVLSVLLDNQVINQGEFTAAITTPIKIDYSPLKDSPNHQYVINAIEQASNILGMTDRELLSKEYKIYTYLDQNNQLYLSRALKSDGYNPHKISQLSMVVDNSNCGVTAYYSNDNQYISQMNRQYGSILKPFSVYIPALESNNYSSATKILDEKININGYSPNNYDHKYHGLVSLRESLKHSYNIPAVRILNTLGIENSLELLNRIGFSVSNEQKNLSIALGSISGNPLTIAGGYSMIANGGKFLAPSLISDIYDKNDKLVYSRNLNTANLVSVENSYIMSDILADCAKDGTASKLKYMPYNISAKTGTVGNSNGDITDVWSTAFTRENTVIAWQGIPSNTALPANYGGGGYPTMLIKDIFEHLQSTSQPIDKPETVHRIPINIDKYNFDGTIEADPYSSHYELFTNFNIPSLTRENLAIKIDTDDMTITAPPSTKISIYKYRFFGGYRLVNEIVLDSESFSIKDWFASNDIERGLYRIECGNQSTTLQIR